MVAGFPRDSILCLLLILIYINDLPDGLRCNPKLFTNDTSSFSTADNNEAATELNNNLIEIMQWAFQWEMSFNPDLSEQADEVIFSLKQTTISHSYLTLNDMRVAQTCS